MEMQQNHHMPTCIHQTPEQLLYNCLHCRPLVRIQPGARIPPARPGGGLKPKLMNVQRNQSRFNAPYWMLGASALGQPRGMVWGGRREEGSGWGTHVYLWRIHFDIWQN